MSSERICVVGLGYVGLPLALAFGRRFKGTVGFDISEKKVEQLRNGVDPTSEGLEQQISATSVLFTADPAETRECNFYVVGVPTPIDSANRPDLSALKSACMMLGPVLSRGDVVVFESTVYPGVTEDHCGPWLEEGSGLTAGVDFKLGYSPERINPGDSERTLEKIVKVVSAQDEETLQRVAAVYEAIIEAGIHRAPCIRVAEAAKVIENTQRDLNIALMNELSLIFDRMNIKSKDVLDAAGTKWNFLPFKPGLVGGHCIGVDPYYLTTKAQELGYQPQVILAGRKINDEMGEYVAQKVVKLLAQEGFAVANARVGVLGLTFKENVADIRNSRVPDIVRELWQFGVKPLIHDPHADPEEVDEEYGMELAPLDAFTELDVLILAVAHDEYLQLGAEDFKRMLGAKGILFDVKSLYHRSPAIEGYRYWAL